jgi:GNAT superfamily N-acetyltransferase
VNNRTAVTLRKAGPADATVIAELWHRGWRDGHLGHVPAGLVVHRQLADFHRWAPAVIGRTTVACEADRILGIVTVRGDEVEQLYVAAEVRGSGVAAELLRHGERVVGTYHDLAWLAVVPGNARARRFYEREGWRDAGEIRHPEPTATGAIPVTARRYEKHTTLEEPWTDR